MSEGNLDNLYRVVQQHQLDQAQEVTERMTLLHFYECTSCLTKTGGRKCTIAIEGEPLAVLPACSLKGNWWWEEVVETRGASE